MKISIIKADGRVTVDGDSRQVDLSGMDARVKAIQFNSDRGRGHIEYEDDAMEPVVERDFDAEREAMNEAKRNNYKLPEGPIMRSVRRRMRNSELVDLALIQPYLDAWTAAPKEELPEPTPLPPAELQRRAALDAEINTETLGAVAPKTLAELRVMSRAEIRDWFNANMTGDAQLRRLVRWMFFFILRRSR